MHQVRRDEYNQRGCHYCLHYKTGTQACPYDECPYHELDTVSSYEEYLRSQEGQVLDFERIFESLTNRGII